jgi:hypothetical protein
MEVDYMETVSQRIDLIIDFQKKTDLQMVWYEDLYSSDYELAKKTFESIGCGLKYENAYIYMDPSKKYRKTQNTIV